VHLNHAIRCVPAAPLLARVPKSPKPAAPYCNDHCPLRHHYTNHSANLNYTPNCTAYARPTGKQRDMRKPQLVHLAGAWRDGCAAKRRPADLPGTESQVCTITHSKSLRCVEPEIAVAATNNMHRKPSPKQQRSCENKLAGTTPESPIGATRGWLPHLRGASSGSCL